MDDLTARFTAGFEELAGMLDGPRPARARRRSGDRRVRASTRARPERGHGLHRGAPAARLGAGILFDSLSTPERCRELIDAYREAGGTGPCDPDPAGVGG